MAIRERTWTGTDGTPRRAWQADFVDQSGKRRHKQFARRKDADAWLVQARGQVQAGTFSPDSTSITVTQAAQLWLGRCERDGLERATLTQYRSHVRHHLGPLLGSVRLSRLTRPMVGRFVDDMLAGGRSRPLARKVLGSLIAIIGEAYRRGLVAQNVAAGVKIATAARHKAKVAPPTPDQVKQLLDGAAGRRRVVLLLAALAGLRASEIRGLRWSDVDFAARVLRVRQRADTSGELGAPKSASSQRDIPMTPALVTVLKEWKLRTGSAALALPGRGERPVCHNTLRDMLGRLHELRHFYASWLIDQGFGPKRVQYLMGHSSIVVTFDTYGHLFPQPDEHMQFAAAERALLGSTP